MDWTGWLSAGCAAVTVVGAAVAWWRTILSRKAKEAAEKARDEAQRTLAAVEKQADAVRAIAEHLEGPQTWLEWEGPQRLSLRTRLEQITVTGLADNDRGNPFRIKGTPMVVTPHHPGVLYYSPTYASRGARLSVGLLVDGSPDPVELPLPSGRPASP